MILGTYQPNIIGKGRIALPKKIRNEIKGERVVLSIGFEKCIFGFEEKTWEKTISPELSRPLSDQEGRKLRRQMCANAVIAELDNQGRMVIPEELLKYGEINDKIVIIGAGDHFEIWSQFKWQEYLKSQ